MDSARQAVRSLTHGVGPSGEVEFEQRLCMAPLDAPEWRMISSTGRGDGPSNSSQQPKAVD